jgi:hypothetical protein
LVPFTADTHKIARDSPVSIALLVVSAAALTIRALATAEPLGIDQSLWASAVRGMARGQKLYQDVWEQRPPGIYLTYLGGFSLFGWTAATVAWLDVLASSLTAVLLYVLARMLAGPRTGAVASALYAVLTQPAWLYSHGGFLERSVCETFIVVCVAAAAISAVKLARGFSVAAAFGYGLAAGAAVVFKPNAGLYFPTLLIFALGIGRRQGRIERAVLLRTVLWASAGLLVIPVATTLWLWRLGLIPEARTAVVDFNRWYVGMGFDPSAYAIAFSKAVWLRMKTDPLWLAGGVASVAALGEVVRTRRLDPLPALAIVWGGGAVLVIGVNGMRLFNSYFIQALAPLTLLVAWWLSSAGSRGWLWRFGVVATVLLMVGLLLQRNYVGRVADVARADAAVLTGRMDRSDYLDRFGGYGTGRGYSARANEELASYLRAHTSIDDQVFLFGINGAGVYFLADRLPAHRFLRVNFFVPDGFPDARFSLGAVIDDLATRRPRYLVFERLHSGSEMAEAVDALPDHPLVRRLLESYLFDTQIEDFALYRLAPIQSGR